MTLAVKAFLPLTTMYISAQSEFADIPIASFPGWGICSVCTVFRSLEPTRSLGGEKGTKSPSEAHGSESRKYSKGRGGKGPHSPLQTLLFRLPSARDF